MLLAMNSKRGKGWPIGSPPKSETHPGNVGDGPVRPVPDWPCGVNVNNGGQNG